MLQDDDRDENDKAKNQVFHGAVIRSGASAAEGLDTNGDQGKTDGEYNRSGDNGREKFTERFQTEA